MIENPKLFQMLAGYTLENEHIERKVMEGDGSDEFPFQVPAFQPWIFRGVKKLTWQWKIHHLKMYFLLKMGIFQCHVSFQGWSLLDEIRCDGDIVA